MRVAGSARGFHVNKLRARPTPLNYRKSLSPSWALAKQGRFHSQKLCFRSIKVLLTAMIFVGSLWYLLLMQAGEGSVMTSLMGNAQFSILWCS